MGMLVDAFYRTQAIVFGSESTFQVVTILYSLPSTLQVPLFSLALSL